MMALSSSCSGCTKQEFGFRDSHARDVISFLFIALKLEGETAI
jgi:hypothetical protein